jgi:hypothetical protein
VLVVLTTRGREILKIFLWQVKYWHVVVLPVQILINGHARTHVCARSQKICDGVWSFLFRFIEKELL